MINHSFGRELLERYGSPLYVYDLEEAERRAKALFELLPKRAKLLYALKANPIADLCATLQAAGCRVEIASVAELKVALEAGFVANEILCSGPGKTVAIVRDALHAGVTHFSCDSWYDLERLAAAASAAKRAASALLRIHLSDKAAAAAGVGAMQSHFGAEPTELLDGGATRLSQLRRVELAGIHVYSGTQIRSPEKLAGTFEHAIHVAEEIVRSGVPLRVLNLGGGFPWPWATSDVPADLSGLRAELERVNGLRRLTADAELWFESGRYLVSSCGNLLATVLDVKVFEAGKTHVILDTGMIHLGGMAGLGRIHRAVASVEPLSTERSETGDPTDVMGPTDSPLDCIARGALVPPLQPGDIVAIPNVGAYGLTASLVAFASRLPPAEVCYRGNSVVAAYRLCTGHERISTLTYEANPSVTRQ
jgi:diaminopimelate decarboxylase